jgi:hypothetical protein
MAGTHPRTVLLKFATSEDRQVIFAKVQGLGGDQAGPGQRHHACIVSTQVEDVAIVQRGQGGKQAHLLARSRTFHQLHFDFPPCFV